MAVAVVGATTVDDTSAGLAVAVVGATTVDDASAGLAVAVVGATTENGDAGLSIGSREHPAAEQRWIRS